MTAAHCRGCGREIVWKTTNHGKKVPLDPRALVYSVVGDIAVKPTPGVHGETFMVSHFNTCPQANDFSASKRQAAPPRQERIFSEPEDRE